jgi:uncharacterized protein YcsI (UPF0317 family)
MMNSIEIRESIRSGKWEGMTVGRAGRYVQTGLVVLPKSSAYDFLVFCQRNPKPCPLLEVTDPGCPTLTKLAPGADIRYEIGSYDIWREGKLDEQVPDIKQYWKKDSVGFMLGSSLTFSQALKEAECESSTGITLYNTNITCVPSGSFKGHMVVTMQTLPPEKVARAVQVTGRFQATHGAPIHIGDPEAIGITDLSKTTGNTSAPSIPKGHVPLFWACSVTPQIIAQETKIDFMITHSSGHGFVTDLMDYDIAVP